MSFIQLPTFTQFFIMYVYICFPIIFKSRATRLQKLGLWIFTLIQPFLSDDPDSVFLGFFSQETKQIFYIIYNFIFLTWTSALVYTLVQYRDLSMLPLLYNHAVQNNSHWFHQNYTIKNIKMFKLFNKMK